MMMGLTSHGVRTIVEVATADILWPPKLRQYCALPSGRSVVLDADGSGGYAVRVERTPDHIAYGAANVKVEANEEVTLTLTRFIASQGVDLEVKMFNRTTNTMLWSETWRNL